MDNRELVASRVTGSGSKWVETCEAETLELITSPGSLMRVLPEMKIILNYVIGHNKFHKHFVIMEPIYDCQFMVVYF